MTTLIFITKCDVVKHLQISLARTDHWMDGSSTDMFNINGGHNRQYIDATYSRHGYYTGLMFEQIRNSQEDGSQQQNYKVHDKLKKLRYKNDSTNSIK